MGMSTYCKKLGLYAVSLFVGVFFVGIAAAMAGTTPTLSSATFKVNSDKLLLTFNMPVFATANGTGALDCTDFTFTNVNAAGFSALTGATCTHTAGNNWVLIEMTGDTLAVAGDNADTITPAANSVFTVGGAVPNKAVALTADAGAPTLSSIRLKEGTTKLLLTYSEPVWTTDYTTAAFADAGVATTDYTYLDGSGDNAASISAVAAHSGSREFVVLTLNAALGASDHDGAGDDTLASRAAGDAASIYDAFGNAVASGAPSLSTGTADSTVPAISSVEGVIGGTRVLITYSEPAFTDASQGAIVASDLAYVDTTQTTRTLSAVSIAHVPGNTWLLVTLSSALTAADITTATADTIAAADGTGAIVDTFANNMANTAVKIDDTTNPVILTATLSNSSNKNILTIVYSEQVTRASGPAANASQASSTTVGDLTTAGTLVGFGAFATTGDITYKTLSNTVALSSTPNTYTFTFGAQTLSSTLLPIKTAGSIEPSGIFTPTTAVTDLAPNAANAITAAATHATLAGASSWDVTPPSAPSSLTISGAGSTNMHLQWSPIAAPADFDRYYVFYRQSSSGTTLANGTAWTSVSDAALATSTTSATNVTGLNTGYPYYFVVYAADVDGNLSMVSNEVTSTTSSSSGSLDSTPPAVPTNLKAVANANGTVTVTWTDSTALDLKEVWVLRTKNHVFFGPQYATIAKGIGGMVDADVKPGETITYAVRANDTSSNLSPISSTVSVTIPVASGTTPAVSATPATPATPAAKVQPTAVAACLKSARATDEKEVCVNTLFPELATSMVNLAQSRAVTRSQFSQIEKTLFQVLAKAKKNPQVSADAIQKALTDLNKALAAKKAKKQKEIAKFKAALNKLKKSAK